MGAYFIKGRGWRYQFKAMGRRYTQAWFKTKKEAQAAEAKRRKEIKEQELVAKTEETRITFGDLLIKRLNHVKVYNSKIYYEAYRFMAARWLAKWEGVPLEEMTHQMVKEHIEKRAETASAHAANKDLRYLKAVFGFAKRERIFFDNPCVGIPLIPMQKKKKYIPTKEDVCKVILAAKPEVQDYLWTIILTMARVGEVNRLTWDDVNFEGRYVTLYTRKKKGGHLTPRVIHMAGRLYDILSRIYQNRDKNKSWVFWQTYWTHEGERKEGPFIYRSKILIALCRLTGVKYFTYHSLRHFGASLLKAAGVSETAIQGNLGHEKLATTHIYLQSLGEAEKDAMDVLEKELTEGEVVDNSKSAHEGYTQDEN